MVRKILLRDAPPGVPDRPESLVISALVMIHVMSPSERRLASLARVRLLALVYQRVRLQLVRIAELGRTYSANVGTLTRVHPQMTT